MLIETVGVGQDEVEIAKLADVTVVVLVPGMGDDVQAIKAGIMEIADVFVINKADQPGADRLEREIRRSKACRAAGRLDSADRPHGRDRGPGNRRDAAAIVSSGASAKIARRELGLRLREMLRERAGPSANMILSRRSSRHRSVLDVMLARTADRPFVPVRRSALRSV